jgi:hypothetical protein
MVYQKDFVAVVSCEGKILREERYEGVDVIKIPFGSHYSIRLKNLSNKKCRVKIEVDGKNIADNKYFLIDGNTEQEIERFLEDNISEGHKFKFIKKTSEISNYRGDRIDDGIIRIEYAFEYKTPQLIVEGSSYINNNDRGEWWFGPPVYGCGTVRRNMLFDTNISCNTEINTLSLEEGFTAKGEKSNQQFNTVNDYATYEETRVINIRLMGYDSSGSKVVKPITTSEKLTCENCGKSSSSFNNFCPRCGSAIR